MSIWGRLVAVWFLNPIIGSIIVAFLFVLSESSMGNFDLGMYWVCAGFSLIGSFIGVTPLFFCLFFVYDFFKESKERLSMRVKQFYWVNATLTLLLMIAALGYDILDLILLSPVYFLVGFYLFKKLLDIELWKLRSLLPKTFS